MATFGATSGNWQPISILACFTKELR